MTLRALTDRPVVEARPTIRLDGRPAIRLGEDLQRLETRATLLGFACLEASFLNWDRARRDSPPDFVHDRDVRLDFGTEIEVTIGGPDDPQTIFQGKITAIEGRYPQNRPPELEIRADDALFALALGQHSRLFEETTDTDIAGQILGAAGRGQARGSGGSSHRGLWQVNQNDLAFLLERARAADAALLVEDGEIVFRPRREAAPEPIRLTRQGELLTCSVSADLVHQRAAVSVHGYSVADKAGIHEAADTSIAEEERQGRGRTGAEIVAEIFPNATEHLELDVPTGSEEARAIAEARMRARARCFLRARGTTSGTPALRVGAALGLIDLGPRFSGTYTAVAVRHCFDQATGFRTHFEAERGAIGAVS